jgi:hypothetical protein
MVSQTGEFPGTDTEAGSGTVSEADSGAVSEAVSDFSDISV